MCIGVMNCHQRVNECNHIIKIELLVQPWCLNGDLNSDEHDNTSDSSKEESSHGIDWPLPRAP